MTEMMDIGNNRPILTRMDDMEIPDSMLKEWQSIVDLLARIGKVRAALIMRVEGEDLKVFMASKTGNSPYRVGEKNHYIGSGLYCERVIRRKKMLHVPDASKSDEWKNNPDMKYNMKCYLGFPIRLPDGNCFGTICMLDSRENNFSQDMKDLMEKMRDLVESNLLMLQTSITDPLTGLYNRTCFDKVTVGSIRDAERRKQPVTALLLDIDHFKSINDTYGHLAGDAVLKGFARVLTASLRGTDVVFRFGGDEFYVIMPHTAAGDASVVAERLRANVEKSRIGPDFSVTTSIGVAERIPGETVDQWFRRADQALYRAKNSLRNRVVSQ